MGVNDKRDVRAGWGCTGRDGLMERQGWRVGKVGTGRRGVDGGGVGVGEDVAHAALRVELLADELEGGGALSVTVTMKSVVAAREVARSASDSTDHWK